jgi:outer membrane lipoprotein SlyB
MKSIYLKKFTLIIFFLFTTTTWADDSYNRNKAVPVQEVLFGSVLSVRNISHEELIKDKNNHWQVFGGALMGAVIGHQFGGGNGKDVTTILGSIIGGTIAKNQQNTPQKKVIHLVELLIEVENGEQFMVIQDFDEHMIFHTTDKIRMIYLANDTVRIDKQY